MLEGVRQVAVECVPSHIFLVPLYSCFPLCHYCFDFVFVFLRAFARALRCEYKDDNRVSGRSAGRDSNRKLSNVFREKGGRGEMKSYI